MSPRWLEVADGILVRPHAELDLNCGLVLGEAADLVAAIREAPRTRGRW